MNITRPIPTLAIHLLQGCVQQFTNQKVQLSCNRALPMLDLPVWRPLNLCSKNANSEELNLLRYSSPFRFETSIVENKNKATVKNIDL